VAYNAHILLGRIIKAHGFDGTVTVKLEEDFIEKIPELESVFLEIDGKPVPFFISESETTGADILWLKFVDYDSVGKINEFIGCKVFLTSTGTGSSGETDSSGLTGCTISLQGNSVIGTVKNIIDNHGQILLVVKTAAGKELLIPFHEDLIVSADKKKKQIVMDLPEGLTEIN
jgi:16S rRNA processing protein RimM